MKILFMDVDGVLNRHQRNPKTWFCSIDRDLAENLNIIINRFDDLDIVVTSSWRYLVHAGSMNMHGFRNLFYSHWVQAAAIRDITRKDISEDRTDRGPQITDWLDKNSNIVDKYLVLDDLDLEITECNHPFIQTESNQGLTVDIMNGVLDYFNRV